MSYCVYMDPINWSIRYYLIKAIDRVGFEGGWQPIIDSVNTLSTTLLGMPFKVNEKQCHLLYLQTLSEFGDFRKYSDELTPPSDEIKQKIEKMRRSELRHELIIANNQIRYNNFILKHHAHEPITCKDMKWQRFPGETEEEPESGILAHITVKAKTKDFFSSLPADGKGDVGLKNLTIDVILARCINGIVSTPMELMRDIFHLVVNLEISSITEREKTAVRLMKEYFLEELRPYLEEDPAWARIAPLLQGAD